MPELPEVETIVRDLKREVRGRTFLDVWTDWGKVIKKPNRFEEFEKEIKGKKIENIRRRGKNILFDLSENKILLVHQKMTGHLLLGKWRSEKSKWKTEIKGPLSDDPMNKFLHLVFLLDDNRQLALSDKRKFAKVELRDKGELENSKEFRSLGPEPLDEKFTFEEFKNALSKKKRGKIKQILMDQSIVAGIGNIYSDEILWRARIHPFKDISQLSETELGKIYKTIKKVLTKAIELGGESISDFRRINGEKGFFDRERKVYRREGEKCPRCGTVIVRKKIGGRSAHFCPHCQKTNWH